MVEIKRIDPEAAAKTISLIYAGLVLIVGIVYLLLVLFTFFLTLLTGNTVDNAALLLVLLGGIGMTLFGLIVCSVLGYVKGWLVASMYNWVAHSYGGVRLETREVVASSVAAAKHVAPEKPSPKLPAKKKNSKKRTTATKPL